MKDIKGYEGLYAVTSCGKVWSYRRKKFLQPIKTNLGYQSVSLSVNGEVKSYLIHRLVAEAYIPNPEGKPQINHKDEVRNHNFVNNLEWVTASENINYGTRNQKMAKSNSIPVYCVELDRVFESAKKAQDELNINKSSIAKACKGKLKTCGGYHWQYANMEDK